MFGGTWERPRYKRIKTLPWIPTESLIDQLIAGLGKSKAPFVQLLKETGMRPGEAWLLKWEDFDFTKNTVSVTPENHSHTKHLSKKKAKLAR